MKRWVQFTAGQGPAECAWAVTCLLRCFVAEAEAASATVVLLESLPGPFPDTLNSALVAVEGERLDAWLPTWLGTILWTSVSPFRPQYKRKNWFVGVSALSVPETPAWSERDVRVDTMCAGGPGGQHVNKTESAVRVTHVPTGIVVLAREERSQHANRRLAFARLAEALRNRGRDAAERDKQRRRQEHTALERGNAVRVYQGARFTRVQ